MENLKRSVTCGELRKSDVGKTVVLNGWVHRTRDLGGIFFISLRDRYGITQVLVGPDAAQSVKKIAASLKSEYGWVHRTRDLGGIFFISLRDRYGLSLIHI